MLTNIFLNFQTIVLRIPENPCFGHCNTNIIFVVIYYDKHHTQFIHIAFAMDKKTFNKKFGNLLKGERERLAISQSELARICLKDRQYIHRLENGTITPTFFTVYFICKELNIEVSSLVPAEG